MAYNAKTIGENSKFISITKMSIDIHLFRVRARNSLRRHKTISHLVWVNIRIIFVVSFELLIKAFKVFGLFSLT